MYSDYALIKKSTLKDIADGIRTKKGTSGLIPPQNMKGEILSIESGCDGYMVVVTILSGTTDLEQGSINDDGSNNNIEFRLRTKEYLEVEPNHLYKIVYSSSRDVLVDVLFYDKNDFATPYMSETHYVETGNEFTTPEGCRYIRSVFKYADAEYEPMLPSVINYIAISMAR